MMVKINWKFHQYFISAFIISLMADKLWILATKEYTPLFRCARNIMFRYFSESNPSLWSLSIINAKNNFSCSPKSTRGRNSVPNSSNSSGLGMDGSFSERQMPNLDKMFGVSPVFIFRLAKIPLHRWLVCILLNCNCFLLFELKIMVRDFWTSHLIVIFHRIGTSDVR